MARGIFIVIEGGDGAGKDTQIDLLRKELEEERTVYTREPGGTELGKQLRQMLLHESHGKLAILAEMFLFLADRAQHVAEVVRPALDAGKTVVSNRSWISTMAYQICGRDNREYQPFVQEAIDLIFHDTPIGLAVILDVAPEVGLERMKKAGKSADVMESMTLEARRRVRQGFLDVAKDLPAARVIDANRSVEEVYADVRKEVLAAIGRAQ